MSVFKCNREGDLFDLIIKQILDFLELAVASEFGLDCACLCSEEVQWLC